MKYLLPAILVFCLVFVNGWESKAKGLRLAKADTIIAENDTTALPDPEPVIVSVDTLEKDSTKQEAIVVKYYQAVDPVETVVPEETKIEEPKKEEPKVKVKERRRDDIRTLTGSQHHGGGYFSLGVKLSNFHDESLAMGGIKAAWVINRTLGFGVDMWGVIPSSEYTDIPNPESYDLSLLGGYGGILLEPILFSNQVVHLTFPVSSGAGWLGYVPNIYGDEDSDQIVDQDVFWYVEPGAAVELNISRVFRLNFAVSKRFTQDLDLLGMERSGFDEMNYTLSMKIGRF